MFVLAATVVCMLSTGYPLQSYRIEPGEEICISEHGVARKVRNNSALPIFVPTNSSSEWQGFLTKATNVTISAATACPPFTPMNLTYYSEEWDFDTTATKIKNVLPCTCTSTGGFTIGFQWDAPNPAVPAPTGYRLYTRLGTTGSWTLVETIAATKEYSSEHEFDCAPGCVDNRYFHVRAYNANGESAPSNEYVFSRCCQPCCCPCNLMPIGSQGGCNLHSEGHQTTPIK